MKNLILIIVLLSLTGCAAGYTGNRYPLQPGDRIELYGTNSHQRAKEFGTKSGNLYNGNNIVITQPATLFY